MQTFAHETLGAARRYWQMALVRGVLAIFFGIIVIVWPHLTFRLFFFVFGIFAIIEGIVLCANAFSHRHASRTGGADYQGRSYYQRADRPSQQGTTYQGPETAQGGATYQRTEGPGQPGAMYQGSEPGQAGGYYQSGQQGASYRQPETRRGGMGMGLGSSSLFQRNWITLLIEGVLTIICGILALILPNIVAVLAIYVVAAWAMFKGIGALMQVHQRGWAMALIGILAIIMSLFLFIDPFGAIRTFMWGVGVFAIIMGVILIARGIQHNAAAHRAASPPEPSY